MITYDYLTYASVLFLFPVLYKWPILVRPSRLANLLLQDAIERIYVGQKYGDIHRGVFLIRGENVVLLGEFVS